MKALRAVTLLNAVRLTAVLFAIAVVSMPRGAVSAASGGSLRIAAIDVEGGQATLFVAPTGQSLLVDTGWPDNNGRDADRVVAAAHELGLQRIDTVLITHYHDDHVGGVPQLAQKISIGQFMDHGAMYEQGSGVPELYAAYQSTLVSGKYKRVSVHAREKLPAPGFDAIAISSDGKVMDRDPSAPVARKAPNPLCSGVAHPAEDKTENGHSLGILIRFAGIKILDAGDLTSDREYDLVCPVDKLGIIDLAIVSHHGSDLSSSKVFVHSLHTRVAIMDNGEHKGGSTSVIDTWRSAPGLKALYQIHAAPPAGTNNPAGTKQGGPEHNAPEDFIANRMGEDGKRIDAAVNPDGSIDVTNRRTGESKHFSAGPQ